jgi:hypothetical protein
MRLQARMAFRRPESLSCAGAGTASNPPKIITAAASVDRFAVIIAPRFPLLSKTHTPTRGGDLAVITIICVASEVETLVS